MRYRRFSWAFAIATVMLAAWGVFSSSAFAAEKMVTIGTAGVTGVYYPGGGAICRLVNRGRKEHGIRCTVESTSGSVYNLEAVRQGDLDLAIVQSDWLYHAYHGSGIFSEQGPNPRLRVLFTLHSEPFTVIARKDAKIKVFDDLKGKRVNLGLPGSGMRATMEELMAYKSWTKRTFANVLELKAADQGDALCRNRIDAMIYAAGHPNGAVQHVTSSCETRLIEVSGPAIDTLIKKHPFYAYATIPGGMYVGNPQDVKTFGVKATLVAPEDLSDDIAYEIVRAVFDNLDNFKTLHPVFVSLDPMLMVKDSDVIPMHEGAARYFREKGLLPNARH